MQFFFTIEMTNNTEHRCFTFQTWTFQIQTLNTFKCNYHICLYDSKGRDRQNQVKWELS